MGFFSFKNKNERYGIIIDVGSGSVLTAIVHSQKSKKHPVIVWAHREHTALKKIDSVEQSARAVLAALMNASLKMDKDGRAALYEYDSNAKLTVTQCSISAPWSYTVTKTINVKQEDQIEITASFIEELVFAAQKQVEEELLKHADNIGAGLTVIAKSTMDLLSNGYRVAHPEGELARHLRLTQATVVSQQYMMDGIAEVQQKLFPKAEINALSFILMMYCTVRALKPHTDDFCLVDITDEATEIGVVRDGSLTYSTHISFGMFSLAREIANVSKIPIHEALGHLRASNIESLKQNLPASSHDNIDQIFKNYIQKVTDLLNETGDSLSIPKKVLLNVEASFSPMFEILISKSAKAATKVDHTIEPIAEQLISKKYKQMLQEQIPEYATDTALILNAEFFHKKDHCLDLDYS